MIAPCLLWQGHARKMVKALLDGGVAEGDVLYWENIEGAAQS